MTSFDVRDFKDPKLARGLIDSIHAMVDRDITLMEVCGTHTVAIARNGIRSLMPEKLHLASGPGCPVCVTADEDIDNIIELARIPGVKLTSFGDMCRVPGTSSSLLKEKASGADVEIVYSPLDALKLAQEYPEHEVVFVGVGFETTTPLVAMTIKRAQACGLRNFSVYISHKNMPHALEALVQDPQLSLSGLILPGHVSTIIGIEPYEFLASTYHIPGVITGFEPLDVLQGIASLVRQVIHGTARVENAYPRAVMQQGNPAARAVMDEVFEVCDVPWRGLGVIEKSGYRIRPAFVQFDAAKRFELQEKPSKRSNGCRCGDVLRGVLRPDKCPLFSQACNPENPLGPCMVSSEGSCAAYYRYYRI